MCNLKLADCHVKYIPSIHSNVKFQQSLQTNNAEQMPADTWKVDSFTKLVYLHVARLFYRSSPRVLACAQQAAWLGQLCTPLAAASQRVREARHRREGKYVSTTKHGCGAAGSAGLQPSAKAAPGAQHTSLLANTPYPESFTILKRYNAIKLHNVNKS